MTPRQIERWIRLGVWWAGAIALADAVAWTIVVVWHLDFPVGRHSWYDAIIFAVLAWGVSRRSRAAATLLLVYWLATKWALWHRGFTWPSVAGALLLGFVFAQSLRAVIAAHHARPLELDAREQPGSSWTKIVR